jgi:hypothetical protein
MPRSARKVDIGGYTLLSDPVTWNPALLRRATATEAIAVPQMPVK